MRPRNRIASHIEMRYMCFIESSWRSVMRKAWLVPAVMAVTGIWRGFGVRGRRRVDFADGGRGP